MTMVINKVPYLRTTRPFPKDLDELTQELDKSYLDTANCINNRVIGLFPTNSAAITGEQWFITGNQRQQGLRQVYTFTGAGNIRHNLNLNDLSAIVRIYGTFTDGTYWYPLPYVDVVDATNQINVIVETNNIVITAGGGSPPTIVNGFVVLEWISFP